MLHYASCVSIGGKAIVLLGASGSGKSDIALRLIDDGARLVADDQVELRRENDKILASPPELLKGLLELRGAKIIALPYVNDVEVHMAIQLVPRQQMERMPEEAFWDCLGVQLRLYSLHGFDNSLCAKIRLLLNSE